MTGTNICYCYWLFNEDCICPRWHGYVGITADLPARLKSHRANKRFPGGFRFVVLLESDEAECFALEAQLRPDHGIGWNPARGGPNQGRTLGYKHSAQSRANVSQGLRGHKTADETKQKIAATLKAKAFRHSLEARAKMSAARKGKPKSAEWRAAIARSHQGIRPSISTRMKISASKRRANRTNKGVSEQLLLFDK